LHPMKTAKSSQEILRLAIARSTGIGDGAPIERLFEISPLVHRETTAQLNVPAAQPFRMWVERVAGGELTGTVVGGSVCSGDEIAVFPAAGRSTVAQLAIDGGDVQEAKSGDTVTLRLADRAEVKAGDLLADAQEPPEVSDQVAAYLVWSNAEPMLPGREYLLQAAHQQAVATITTLKHKINVENFDHQAAATLEMDDIGYCNLSIDQPFIFDPFLINPATGTFVLVDRLSGETAAAGMIEFGLRRATNIHWQELDIDKNERAGLKSQRPCVLWFTGLSGSGKSTLSNLLEKQLHARGRHTYVLDGDNVRHGLSKDLGFTDADRVENIRRVAEAAKLMVEAGLIVMASFISPFRSERRMARDLFDEGEFLEVFVDAPLNVCEGRDPKGLYKKARAGEIKNFTGIDSDYELPERAEIRLDAASGTPEDLVADLLRELEKRKLI